MRGDLPGYAAFLAFSTTSETGHVGFVASLLGPRGRAPMRGLSRLLGLRLADQLPGLAYAAAAI